MKKILTVIGARPQFIKAAPVSRAISKVGGLREIMVHTGQHFDSSMSDIFFEQMNIPKPDYNLSINSLSHGAMTGRMLEQLEKIMEEDKPDLVLVYGDTNSTLAGALSAAKLHIPVAHVEAGLRSFNMKMPEEINRILTDRISNLLFCASLESVNNLKNEGFEDFKYAKVIYTGDVMKDAAKFFEPFAVKPEFDLPEKYILATVHRAENTDDLNRLINIFSAFEEISKEVPVVLPLHPRTKKILDKNNLKWNNVIIVEPVGYLQMIYMIKNSLMIMTDSGGLQKEAFFYGKPCVTLRDETEWVELVENGVNKVVGASKDKILNAVNEFFKEKPDFSIELYGDGKASEQIVTHVKRFLNI